MNLNFHFFLDFLAHRRVFLSYQYEYFSLWVKKIWSLLPPAHVPHFWGKTTISLLKNLLSHENDLMMPSNSLCYQCKLFSTVILPSTQFYSCVFMLDRGVKNAICWPKIWFSLEKLKKFTKHLPQLR